MLYFKLPVAEYEFLISIDDAMFKNSENIVQTNNIVQINFKDELQLEDFQADMSGAQVYYGMSPNDELTDIGRRIQDIYDSYFVQKNKMIS